MFSLQQWPVRHPSLGSTPVWVLGKPCPPDQRSGSWPLLCSVFLPPLNTAALSRAGVPSLQALMPDDLRWSCCNSSRHKAHNKCTPESKAHSKRAPESSHDHAPSSAPPGSVEKLSSVRPVLGARKVGAAGLKSQEPLAVR